MNKNKKQKVYNRGGGEVGMRDTSQEWEWRSKIRNKNERQKDFNPDSEVGMRDVDQK